MTTLLAERRKGLALTFGLAALALVVIAAITVAIEARSSRPDLASGPVVPGLSESIGGAQRIIVTTADATYRIEKTERGWAMRDRGDYPVLASRLQQLTDGLEQLHFQRRMTSDASKHERLGVTDPRQGGRGIMVQVEDGRGALLVNLIFGVETSGTYVRRPDDDQTWAVREGETHLPPFRDVASWLDLRPLDMEAAQLARVEIQPTVGRAYILGRDTAQAGFGIVSPPVQPLAQSSVQEVAEKLTQLSPIDVQPAPAIQGPARARVRATTFEGIAIEAELIDADGKTWVKLVARAATPEQEQAALAINTRVAGWAYALSTEEAAALAPPLSDLLPGVAAPAP
ncbi:DUF4340 domain-containing protein [Terricaulis sp.]|uniref:DUF4340 domain-containing protein n=1 Tax=Terricaulis sp. TaxID=2768686 RepID=UPI003784DAC2